MLLDEFLGVQIIEFISVGQALQVVALFIVADALMGVMVALRLGQFDFQRTVQFLATNALPYLGGLLVLGLLAVGAGEHFAPVFIVIAGMVAAVYLHGVLLKAIKLFGLGGGSADGKGVDGGT